MPMKGESWLTEGVGPHPNSLLPAKGDDTTGTCPPQPAHLSPLQISPRQAYAAAAQKALHCKHKPRAHRPGKWPQETLTHNTYEGQGTYGAFQRLLKSSLVQHFLGSSLNTHTHTQKFDIKGLPPLANIVSSSAKTPQPLQPGSAKACSLFTQLLCLLALGFPPVYPHIVSGPFSWGSTSEEQESALIILHCL